MSSARKVQEAEFFVELLDALEQRGSSLTHVADVAAEASFLLAAALNSLYSAVAIMGQEEGIDVSQFRDQHPEVFARADDGGERAKTVHVCHTEASSQGYIPPPGNAVNFYLRQSPKLCPEPARVPGRVDLQLRRPMNIYVQLRDREMSILEFLQEHLAQLVTFRRSVGL